MSRPTVGQERCGYGECFVPPERHQQCAARGITACFGRLGHQHVPKRSQGGHRCDVMLCQGHSDCIDNGLRYEGRRLSNDVKDGLYRILDRETGEVLREVVLEVAHG